MLFYSGGQLLAGILLIVNVDGVKLAFLKDKFMEVLKPHLPFNILG